MVVFDILMLSQTPVQRPKRGKGKEVKTHIHIPSFTKGHQTSDLNVKS